MLKHFPSMDKGFWPILFDCITVRNLNLFSFLGETVNHEKINWITSRMLKHFPLGDKGFWPKFFGGCPCDKLKALVSYSVKQTIAK